MKFGETEVQIYTRQGDLRSNVYKKMQTGESYVLLLKREEREREREREGIGRKRGEEGISAMASINPFIRLTGYLYIIKYNNNDYDDE